MPPLTVVCKHRSHTMFNVLVNYLSVGVPTSSKVKCTHILNCKRERTAFAIRYNKDGSSRAIILSYKMEVTGRSS